MDRWEIFLTIGVILGFMGTVYKMFYQPIHELTLRIVQLTEELKASRDGDVKRDSIIAKHSDMINKHDKDISLINATLGNYSKG